MCKREKNGIRVVGYFIYYVYVFIPYYIWKKTNWKKNTKIITTSIFVLLMIIFMIGGANKEKRRYSKI